MKTQDRRHSGRGIRAKAVAVAAGAIALTLGATVAASADGGSASLSGVSKATRNTVSQQGKTAFASKKAAADDSTWIYGIDGRDSAGDIWDYPPNQKGGFEARENRGSGLGSARALFKNNSANDGDVNVYSVIGSTLRVYTGAESSGKVLGSGWNVYNTYVTPGNLGGASNPDLLARDTGGTLWVYLGYSNGSFAARTKVGAGWGAYTQIAGYGDLTGDGKADIVARDKSGTLWLYKGTGNYKAPFAARTKVGAGWNTYNKILGLGDTNADGKYDLIARATNGDLYLYPGTGKASAPYGPRKKIGNGWNVYNYLF